MKGDNEDNRLDDNKFHRDIERYGWTVLMIPASDYLPSFAYAVGLFHVRER